MTGNRGFRLLFFQRWLLRFGAGRGRRRMEQATGIRTTVLDRTGPVNSPGCDIQTLAAVSQLIDRGATLVSFERIGSPASPESLEAVLLAAGLNPRHYSLKRRRRTR